MLRAVLLLTTAAGLIGADAYFYGTWTDRWGASGQLQEAAGRLHDVPAAFDGWEGEDVQLPGRTVELAEISDYVYRRYRNKRTGGSFEVLLVCGRGGPMAVHTPDVCYRASGYRQEAPEATVEVERGPDLPPAQCRGADFIKDTATGPSRLRILWAWNAGGGWEAPGNPRRKYAGRPALYKLYVAREVTSRDGRLEEEQCKEFVRRLL